MSPKSNVWCHPKKRKRHRETHREDGHVNMKSVIGVMLLHPKEWLGPPELFRVVQGRVFP